MSSERGFSTKTIHGETRLQNPLGALTPPIFPSVTYRFDNCAQGGARFAGEEGGYIYTRLGNPTTTILEERVALLENAEGCVAFSSGMGAVSSVIWCCVHSGAHVLADTTLYGCTYTLLMNIAERFGVQVELVDMADLGALQKALRPETTMVYFESPANPNIKISDIAGVAQTTHQYNPDIRVVFDNTFATPYLQQPLTLDCDVVIHSATKYLNGHGDLIAGFACANAVFIETLRSVGLKDMTGAVQSAFDSSQILRGMKTLELRMDRHCQNTEKLATYLDGHPKVERVYYPGLPHHPGHEIAKRQMRHFGPMLSFEVKGGLEAGMKLLDNLKLCVLAVSLGDPETLVEHAASMTHSTWSPEERAAAHVSDGLIRVSPGLENFEDILADFEQSLALL